MDGHTSIAREKKPCIYCDLYIGSLLVASVEIAMNLAFAVYYSIRLWNVVMLDDDDGTYDAEDQKHRVGFYSSVLAVVGLGVIFGLVLLASVFQHLLLPIRLWCYGTPVLILGQLIVLIMIWIWDSIPFGLIVCLPPRLYFVYHGWALVRQMRGETTKIDKFDAASELEKVASLLYLHPGRKKLLVRALSTLDPDPSALGADEAIEDANRANRQKRRLSSSRDSLT